MAVETAIVAPVLVLLALGSFDVSRVVSRQHELQAAVGEAESIALAAGPTTDVDDLKTVLVESLALEEDEVSTTKLYRCDDDEDLVAGKELCGDDSVISTYIRVQLRETYEPIWTEFGIERPIQLNVDRTVQLI